jgi:hypothetical protein
MADNLAYSCGSALLSSSLSPTPLQMSVEERDGAPAGVTGRCLVVGLTVTYDALAHTAVAECEPYVRVGGGTWYKTPRRVAGTDLRLPAA